MSSKIVDLLGKKLKQSQIIVDIIAVRFISRADKKTEQSLAICSLTLHLIQGSHLKKSISIETIKMVTLSTFSNQLILHCMEEDLWIESFQNVKILKNILKIREKVLKDASPLSIYLEKEKSLQAFVVQQSKIKRFWQGVFGKKDHSEQERPARKSFCTLEVKDKDFVIQIAKNIYRCNYKNAELLYISGSNGFMFNEFQHSREDYSQSTFLYQHKKTKDFVMMRRINKPAEENKKLKRYLEQYKLQDYNQQILFAVQTVRYYEIITPYYKQQKSLEELLAEQKIISEIDLLSIFYKLMSFTQGGSNILHSLSPKEIIIRQTIIISSVFCINQDETNIAYLAPEEIDKTLAQQSDIQLINLWKIGMLLYQSAFLILPFPIQYLADVVASGRKLEPKFPRSGRSESFKDFLKTVLVVDPKIRGGPGWQKSIFHHHWIQQSCRM